MNLETFQLPLLPLLVVHAAHTLHNDLSQRPRLNDDTGRARLAAQALVALWFAMNLAPVGYYSLECVKHCQHLFA
jgi:hypothetical protein